MRRKLDVITLFGTWALILGLSFNCLAEDIDKQEKELRTQITIYNLVNGLYLTEDQMDFILNKSKKLHSLQKKLQNRKKSDSSNQREALLALREEVRKEVPQVSEDLAKEIHRNNFLMLKLRKEYIDALSETTEQVKSKLTDKQIYLIQSFKPCLIPPKGPARMGQISSQAGPTKLLERVRNMPTKRYKTRKSDIADRYIKRLSLKFPYLSDRELSEAKTKFLRIMDDVRGLSDLDFALQKKDIANEIKNIVIRGEHKEKQIDEDKKIARFLLNSQIIPVLEEKLSIKEERPV